MTTSIVFDDTRLCTDFESNTALNPDETDILTDPDATREALQRLRILKTRETGDLQQIPNTTGRETGNIIPFNSYTYYELQMRRKATVLRNTNNNFVSSKTSFSNIANNKSSRYSSKTRLKQLAESNQCETQIIIKKSRDAGIKNGNANLYFFKEVPYFKSL